MTDKVLRAVLEINEANHPLFDGLNLIGRCKKASVILKDTLISQQQAIITILNDKHFISDANSSNGTCLNKNPLTPLKLYELTDDSTIDFAGISARYKKVTGNQHFNITQDVSNESCSESMFKVNTQLLQSTIKEPCSAIFDIHEAETQTSSNEEIATTESSKKECNGELCENDMNKQIGSKVFDEDHSKTIDIHELTTQTVESSNTNNAQNSCSALHPNDEDDDSDITDSENDNKEQLVLPKANNDICSKESLLDAIVEETVLESSHNDSITQNIEQSDDSNSSIDLMLHDTQKVISNRNNTPETSQEKSDNTQETVMQVALLKKKSSRRIKSDDDSDTDTDKTQTAGSDTEERLHLSQLRRRTRQLLNSDTEDEADVEGALRKMDTTNENHMNKTNDSDIIPTTQDVFDDSKEAVTGKESMNVTSQRSDSNSVDNFKLGLTQFLNSAQIPNSIALPETSHHTENMPRSPEVTTVLPEHSIEDLPNHESTARAVIPNSLSLQQDRNDEIFFQPTQMVTNDKATNDDSLFLKPTSDTTEIAADDDFYLMPTQKVVVAKNIFDDPTQKITTESSNPEEHCNTKVDDLYTLPTQLLENDKDVFLAPPQQNPPLTNGNNDKDVQLLATQKICTDAEIFNQQTQDLNEIPPSVLEGDVSNGNEACIYNLATQKVTTNTQIFDLQTQKVEENSEDIYLLPTQKVSAPQRIDDVESQLETVFTSQTIAYTENANRRLGNPIADTFESIEANGEDSQKASLSAEINTGNIDEEKPIRKSLRKHSKQCTETIVEKDLAKASVQNEHASTSKHKIGKNTSVKSSKRVKLNTDEELDSINDLSSDSNTDGTNDLRNVRPKETTKSSDNHFNDDEIQIIRVTKRTRKKEYTIDRNVATAEDSGFDLTSRSKRLQKIAAPSTFDVTEPSRLNTKSTTTRKGSRSETSGKKASLTSSHDLSDKPTKSVIRDTNRNKRHAINDELVFSNATTSAKRKVNLTVKSEIPVKRNKTENSDLALSCNSSNNTELFTTPKRRGRGRVTEITNTSAVSTPERSKRKQKPKVVFTMFESPELESAVRQLGGSMVDTVDNCTVLVTEYVKRTQKLLEAIGQGKPICSPNWIRESRKVGEFLDPWDHLLLDKEAETKWKFSLKESLMRGQATKLLADYHVHLIVSNMIDVLKGAIETCGGKCYTRTPSKGTLGKYIIVSTAENKSKYNKFLKQNPKPIIVTPEAIFDGVLRQELHLEDHVLT